MKKFFAIAGLALAILAASFDAPAQSPTITSKPVVAAPAAKGDLFKVKGVSLYDSTIIIKQHIAISNRETTPTYVRIIAGLGSPEAAVVANPGSLYLRTNGGAGTSLYIKETGTGNTGWIAK